MAHGLWFHLIALAGRVVRRARRLMVRLSGGTVDLIRDARSAILSLQPAPSGWSPDVFRKTCKCRRTRPFTAEP